MSIAAEPFTDDDLAALLDQARSRNAAVGVTGLLVHKDGRFMQLLEGPDDAVSERFAAIEQDPRHHDVRSLIRESVPERRFSDWAMAFRPLDDASAAAAPGFSPFLDVDAAVPSDRTSATWLLHWFRERELADGDA